MRRSTPREFYADMAITLDMPHKSDKTKWGESFCGVMIDGYRFMVMPSGNTWMIYKLNGYKKAHGKQMHTLRAMIAIFMWIIVAL